MNNLPAIVKKALVGILAFLVGACHSESTGSIRKSPEVAEAFETLQFQGFPKYRYYFLNQENSPFGVAGLEPPYWIEGPDWRECDPASPLFGKVVGLVQSFPVQNNRTEGFAIADPGGRQIGVWYSSLSAGITVDPDTHKVMITTSTPWLRQ